MKEGNKILLASLTVTVLLITIFLVLNSNRVHAEDVPGMPFNLTQENIEKIPTTPEEAQNASIAWIKKSWGENLRSENSFLGRFVSPILKGYDKISPYSDPVFKIILGIAPELSWLFILTFVLWITLITHLYSILSVFSTFSKFASLGISLAMTIIISTLGIPKLIAQKIINLISFMSSWWMQLIVILIIIAIFVLLTSFKDEWEIFKKKLKEKHEKKELKEKVEKAEIKSEAALRTTKTIADAFNDEGAGI